MFREIFMDDCYRLRTVKTEPSAVLDIGANVGFFAVYARALFPYAEILCIEPTPETIGFLIQNTAWLNVKITHLALGNGAPLYPSTHVNGDGSNQCQQTGRGATVPTETLAQLLGRVNPKSVMVKMDCEGGEAYVLRNAADLAQFPKLLHWAMEFHTRMSGMSFQDAHSILLTADSRTTMGKVSGDVCLFWSNQERTQ